MGAGALRRYHPTLDEQLAEDAGVEVGDRFNEEGNKSLDGLTTSHTVGQDDTSHVQDGGVDAITDLPTDEQVEALGGDPDNPDGGDDTEGETAADRAEASDAPAENLPSRGASTQVWRDYAAAIGEGNRPEDWETASRDDLATYFHGPKA